MVSQLAVSISKQSSTVASSSASSVRSPVGVSSVASTPMFAVVSAMRAPTMPSATAYVAPQVFGEMPKPNSGHGTHVITPGYEGCCYGYPNQIQSSCVQEGSTNLSEQHLDGLPQHYGFDNLKGQSVFLADGTKHSFYALPQDYPLEQVPPPMSPSAAENVGVMAKLYVAAQAANVQDFTLELQQHEDKRACNYSVLKAFDSLVTRSGHFSIEHSLTDLRLLWDPGAPLPHLTRKTQHYGQALQPASHATALAGSSVTHFSGCKWLPFLDQNIYVFWESKIGMKTYISWDPGIALSSYKYSWLESGRAGHKTVKALVWLRSPFFGNLQYQLPMSKTSFVWDPGMLILMDMMLGKSAVPNLVHSGQTTFKLPFFVEQPVDLKQLWAQLL